MLKGASRNEALPRTTRISQAGGAFRLNDALMSRMAPSRTDSVLILGVPCTEGAFGAKGAFTS